MDRLRVGVIGIGRYAASRHVPEFRATAHADIAAISRRNPELLRLAQKELGVPNVYESWQDLIGKEPLDAVVVSTSVANHPEPTIAALERGLHVLVEKPMALTSLAAAEMVDAARKSNRVLMVGYNCRLRWQWKWAQRLIAQGVLGKVRHVTASWCVDMRAFLRKDEQAAAAARDRAKSGGLAQKMTAAFYDPGYWRFDPHEVGSLMLVEVATHLVDLILWLCGDEAAQVHAVGGPLHERGVTSTSVLAQLRSGTLCSLSFSDTVAGDGLDGWGNGSMSLWADEGTVSAVWDATNPRRAALTIAKHGMPLRPAGTDLEDATPAEGFISAIRNQSANPCPPEEGAKAVRFIEAAMASIQDRHPMALV